MNDLCSTLTNEFSGEITANLERVSEFTKDQNCVDKAINILEKYTLLDKKVNSDLSCVIATSLGWIAEFRKNSADFISAAECYQMPQIADTVTKYQEDVANEVLTNITYVVEECLNREPVERYLKWLNNGHVSKLLDAAAEFSQNGGLKIRTDIFSILGVKPDSIEKFNELANKFDNRKTNLQEKIRYLSILKDIVNLKKYENIENMRKIQEVAKLVESEIGIKIKRNTSSIKCALLLTNDIKEDKNVEFLVKKHIQHGSVSSWFNSDETASNVINEIDSAGLRSKILVASGKKIKEDRIDGNFSEKWPDALKYLICKIVGNKSDKLAPKISIHNMPPTTIFDKIKADYFTAIKNDKEAALRLLETLRNLILTAYQSNVPSSVKNILSEIDTIQMSVEHDIPLNHKGAKITAKIWTRRVPNDFYHSERLRCCMYLPNGEVKDEIALYTMDPKTTLLQYWIQGIDEPVAAATLYPGMSNGRPVLFLDTWDAGGLTYIALGSDKTKEFVIDTLVNVGKRSNAASVLVFSKAVYGRPEEFCNYMRRKGFSSSNVGYKSIDVKDTVLKKHSATRKHHYTDAFDFGKMEGNVEAFNIEL